MKILIFDKRKSKNAGSNCEKCEKFLKNLKILSLFVSFFFKKSL